MVPRLEQFHTNARPMGDHGGIKMEKTATAALHTPVLGTLLGLLIPLWPITGGLLLLQTTIMANNSKRFTEQI